MTPTLSNLRPADTVLTTVLALACLASCGAEDIVSTGTPEDAPLQDAWNLTREEPAPPQADRFVGEWVLSQPNHALYEATLYRFGAEGTLEVLASFPEGYEVGRASVRDLEDCSEDDAPWSCTVIAECTFVGPWRSEGDDLVVVGSTCSDGAARDVSVLFHNDASTNSEWAEIEVVRVGEYTEGLVRTWPDWAWTKCAGGNGAPVSESWACQDFEGP